MGRDLSRISSSLTSRQTAAELQRFHIKTCIVGDGLTEPDPDATVVAPWLELNQITSRMMLLLAVWIGWRRWFHGGKDCGGHGTQLLGCFTEGCELQATADFFALRFACMHQHTACVETIIASKLWTRQPDQHALI